MEDNRKDEMINEAGHGHHHEHHDHEHDHHHEHEHGHGHHHHEHEGEAPDKRLFALLNYMYSHNSDHTNELEQMAASVRSTGNEEAYEHTMEAVRFFKDGNEALKKAIDCLNM